MPVAATLVQSLSSAPLTYEVDPKALGGRVRRTRKGYGWTLKALSARTKVPIGTLSAHECGKRVPRWPQMVQLARVLRRTLDFLLLGKADRKDRSPGP